MANNSLLSTALGQARKQTVLSSVQPTMSNQQHPDSATQSVGSRAYLDASPFVSHSPTLGQRHLDFDPPIFPSLSSTPVPSPFVGHDHGPDISLVVSADARRLTDLQTPSFSSFMNEVDSHSNDIVDTDLVSTSMLHQPQFVTAHGIVDDTPLVQGREDSEGGQQASDLWWMGEQILPDDEMVAFFSSYIGDGSLAT